MQRQGKGRHRVGTRDAGSMTAVTYALYANLLVSLLLLGGANWNSAIAGLTLTCVVSIVFWSTVCRGWNFYATLFLALAVWTAVTALPLPQSLLTSIAPSNDEIWKETQWIVHGKDTPWNSLSLDPIASLLEVAKWTAYALSAALATALASKKGLREPIKCVFLAGVCLSLSTLLHDIVDAQSYVGLYRPTTGQFSEVLGPLLNENTRAGYANLGAFCGLALVRRANGSTLRGAYIAGILLCCWTTLSTESRGGTITLLLGVVYLGLRYAINLDGRFLRKGALMFAMLALPTGILLATNNDHILDGSDDKFGALGEVVQASARFPIWGVGRGAFESVSERLVSMPNNVIYQKVENVLISWLIEWGALLSIGLAGIILWRVYAQRAQLKRSRTVEIVSVGLVVVVVQNLADLGLEMPSLCMAIACVVGGLVGSLRKNGGIKTRRKALSASFCLVLLALSLLGAHQLGPDAMAARHSLHEQYSGTNPLDHKSMAEFQREVDAEISRRPGSSYPHLLLGLKQLDSERDALPALARALRAAPHSGQAHFAAALALQQQHSAANQALLHLRHAGTYAPAMTPQIASSLLSWSLSEEQLLRAIPKGHSGWRLLTQVAQQSSDPGLAKSLLERAVQLAPDELAPTYRLNQLLLRTLRRMRSECASEESAKCETVEELQPRIEALTTRLENQHPHQCEGLIGRAELLESFGSADRGVELLENQCHTCVGSLICAHAGVELAARSRGVINEDLMNLYLQSTCTNMPRCANAETWLAGLAANHHKNDLALRLYKQAAQKDPNVQRWTMTANAARIAEAPEDVALAHRHLRTLGAPIGTPD